MLSFIIDIFCKDTITGLKDFKREKPQKLYKNKYSSLFETKEEYKNFFLNY
jgi:hypothetical protein